MPNVDLTRIEGIDPVLLATLHRCGFKDARSVLFSSITDLV